MDFGDYIYVILAIVFSIVSAVSKKRKAKNKSAVPSKSREIFEELFDTESDVDDFVPQPSYANDEFNSYSYEDDESIDVVKEQKNDLKEKLDSLYNLDTSKEEVVGVKEKSTKPLKPHPIMEGITSREEVQKAVIYSEIFQRKF